MGGMYDGDFYSWPIAPFRDWSKKIKAHDCKPRGGPPGTFERWLCPICGRRFKSVTGKKD